MNSYTDSDMNKITFISIMGFCISVTLLICFIGKGREQIEINNQIENRIKMLETTHQK